MDDFKAFKTSVVELISNIVEIASIINYAKAFEINSTTEVLNALKSSMMVGVNCFQIPVKIDILSFSHESCMFLMASRMVNPFQVFNWLYQDP